jgi:hypothetical protein
MNELSKVDLHHILSRTPRDVRDLLKANKLFLTGGFIRAIIAGEKPSDIDLLGPDKTALEMHAVNLANARSGRVHKTDNALTVLSPPKLPVQMITRWTYDDPEKLISEFDFTIVQAAIWYELVGEPPAPGENWKGEWKSVCSDGFYPDLAARRLVYTHPVRHEDAGGSILRVIKYIKRGYNIQVPSLAGVVARFTAGLKISNDSISIIDGVERINETWAAPILMGLLREVDPLAFVDGIEMVDELSKDVSP